MKLKCADGTVRSFTPAVFDGELLANGLRASRSQEAVCDECGEPFGVHDTWVLKQKFRAHTCEVKKEGQ